MRRLEDHEHDVHDIRRAEDDPSCWPASFKRNEFPAPHSLALVLSLCGSASGTLQGPTRTTISESGGTYPNWGSAASSITNAHLNHKSDGDDCDRTPVSHQWAESEWTWTLQGSSPTTYSVGTLYLATGLSTLAGDVDDFLDRDYSDMENVLRIKNDNNGEAYQSLLDEESVSNPPAEEYQNYRSKQSGAYVGGCFAPGSLFSCSTTIESKVQIVSEAWATAGWVLWVPGCSYQVVACPP